MSIRSIWQEIAFAFLTWRVKRQIKRDDRNGTGPLSARAYRKRTRGEPLTPEEQESLDSAEAFLSKIRTPEKLQPKFAPPRRSGYEAYTKGDYVNAIKEFRSSADEGDPVAMDYLGMMFDQGLGVSVNHCEAAQWFLRAAELGHHDSQFALGCMYREGRGIPQNLNETIRWWRKAAEQGNSMAQYNLGLMYTQGEGVREDPLEARQWIEKAAEQGEARAFYNLGHLYLAEPKDYVRAYKWLTLSIMNVENHTKAAEMRRELEAVMTPEQIAEAEKLAREWTQKENKIFRDILNEYQQSRMAHQLNDVQQGQEALSVESSPIIPAKVPRAEQLLLLVIVAAVSAWAGYAYKAYERPSYPPQWIDIPDNVSDPFDRVQFSSAITKSYEIPPISIGSIETKVKFVSPKFSRTDDADLRYILTLDVEKSGPVKMSRTNSIPQHQTVYITSCDVYLIFELYDKDGVYLAGLIGPHFEISSGQKATFQGNVDEEIPRQMALQTAMIKRRVMVDECRHTGWQ